MRMRQLGLGQSLVFVASPEVDQILKKDFFTCDNNASKLYMSNEVMRSFHYGIAKVHAILIWTLSNTVKKICDLIPYFVSQFICTLHKASAYNKLVSNKSDPFDKFTVKNLAISYVEEEVLELHKLYGHSRGIDNLPSIVYTMLKRSLNSDNLVVHDLVGDTRGFNITTDSIEKMPMSATEQPDSDLKFLNFFSTEIQSRVKRIAAEVHRPCSMLDEEQERELEHELEEEMHVELPGPAKPLEPHVSEGLIEVLKSCSRSGLCPLLCKRHLAPLSDIFSKTSFAQTGKQHFNGGMVFVTQDFVLTVEGKQGLDNYVKDIRWIIKPRSANGKGDGPFILISNFEAEYYARMLNRMIFNRRKKSVDISGILALYYFAPLTRLQQPRQFLTISSFDPPPIIHVLGGSVHADNELQEVIQRFLGICPYPGDCGEGDEKWNEYFSKGWIERDGFVPDRTKRTVLSKLFPIMTGSNEKWNEYFSKGWIERDGFVPVLSKLFPIMTGSNDVNICPFTSSPVEFLIKFLCNVRYLGEELSSSKMGKLLGSSEIETFKKVEDLA
uniref:Uncharacterized protein n=2 Tax=Corethron hystrix TaxID=216773 RepID=A0A7S1BTA9_9STRA|mmetsp:Transcript_38725/g.90018  ORF Transcript_38725/g.90018 Transcript_38725/m.90018 type:complete len:555 (+) Transcript_38725:888-2552(+)